MESCCRCVQPQMVDLADLFVRDQVADDPAVERLIGDVRPHQNAVTRQLDLDWLHLEPCRVNLRLIQREEALQHLPAVCDLAGGALAALGFRCPTVVVGQQDGWVSLTFEVAPQGGVHPRTLRAARSVRRNRRDLRLKQLASENTGTPDTGPKLPSGQIHGPRPPSAFGRVRVVAVAVALADLTAFVLNEQLAVLSARSLSRGVDGILLAVEGAGDSLVALAALRPPVSVADNPLVLAHRDAPFCLAGAASGGLSPRAGC